jgi:hypothetical protein
MSAYSVRQSGLIFKYLFALLIAGACASPLHAQEWVYTARPGDTLWDIAEKYTLHLGYVGRLQRHNNIEDADTIKPGTRIRFPVEWLKKQPVPAIVLSVSGEAGLRKNRSDDSLALAAGERVTSGDEITVGPDSSVLLQFADGSEMTIRQNSLVVFDLLSQYGDTGMVDTRARLQRGRTESKVNKLSGEGSQFVIITPVATTSVRGTLYRVNADEEQDETRVEVLEGAVDADGSGETARIDQGYGSVTRQGMPPEPPRKLLQAPDLSAIPSKIDRVPVRLEWSELEGAASYRVEISSAADFNVLETDLTVDSAKVNGIVLENDGDYFLRIRGIDDQSLEGINATRPFVLDARPEPPSLLSPGPDQVLRDGQVEFLWSKPLDIDAFRLELSTSESFDSPQMSLDLTDAPRLKLKEPLEPGKYFWRMVSFAEDGEQGPYGDTQSFSFVPPPPGPSLEPPEVSDDQVTLRWRSDSPDQTYNIQVSQEPEFGTLMLDEIVADPQHVLSGLKGGTYYYRIATIDADGTMGPFTNVRELSVPKPPFWHILLIVVPYLLLLP